MMDIHRKKCSISQVGRKCQLSLNANLFDTHQIGKQLRGLRTLSADAGRDGGIAYTFWNVCALVPQPGK